MFDFIIIILSAIGFVAASFGIGSGISSIHDRIHTERERRRKHEQHLLTVLTRIADNTETKS